MGTESEQPLPYNTCPVDASDMVWQELDFLPGYWAWVCPECGYLEF